MGQGNESIPVESKRLPGVARLPTLAPSTQIKLSIGSLFTLAGVIAAGVTAWSHVPSKDEVQAIAAEVVRSATDKHIDNLRELNSKFAEERSKNEVLTKQVERLESRIDLLLKPKNPKK